MTDYGRVEQEMMPRAKVLHLEPCMICHHASSLDSLACIPTMLYNLIMNLIGCSSGDPVNFACEIYSK
jgi:hypothetical protein